MDHTAAHLYPLSLDRVVRFVKSADLGDRQALAENSLGVSDIDAENHVFMDDDTDERAP